MLQPNIAKCYDKLFEYPSLLLLFFSEQECSSLQELPMLGALHFRLISDRLFAHIASPNMWGMTRVEFMTDTSLMTSGEATPIVIVITDGVGEVSLGMVMVFCHHDQNKLQASHALSVLCQWDSPEPWLVVVRRYTNTPNIPWGNSQLLYLDVSTLSRGASSTQSPLDHLCLQRLLPYS